MLSESLEIANNNIEAYLVIANDALLANNVLVLKVEELQNSKDKLIQLIDSVAKDNNIKIKALRTAATQTQSILVNKLKNIDSIYIYNNINIQDSIKFNDYTDIYYNISNNSIDITLDIRNTQYLYTYKTREYKNKKSFLKRLFTLDFKKVDRYKYNIVNTNNLIKESDIRIIEQNE